MQHLKEVLRKIESLNESTEWQRLEADLRKDLDRLEKAQNDHGNEKTAQHIEQLRSQTDQVIRSKEVKMGRDILKRINGLYIQLTLVYQCMGFIRDYNERIKRSNFFGMRQNPAKTLNSQLRNNQRNKHLFRQLPK